MKALWTAFNYLGITIAFCFSLLVLSKRERRTGVTLAWVLSFFLLPFFGPALYLLVGYQNFRRRRRLKPAPGKKLQEYADTAEEEKATKAQKELSKLPIVQLGERLTGFPISFGNHTEVTEGEEGVYHHLSEALLTAKHHIHLQYYIFSKDDAGKFFRDLLIKKSMEGVKCRLLVDHVGSFELNQAFIQPMLDAGVRFAFFWPLTFKRPWGFHFRNHRKFAIIDGKIGFTGSQNISNPYPKWRLRKISWIDTLLKIEGPAVRHLQSIFLEDWEFSTGESVADPEYYPELLNHGKCGIQVLPTGPDESESGLEKLFMTLVHSAEHRVTLLTPYFVPTVAISLSLETAVLRGVNVEILVPKQSDHWLVDAAAQSWYRDLLRGGVKIYECADQFIHSKVVTTDGRIAMIGSANMDERSFRVNFECSTFVYDSPTAKTLESTFDRYKALGKQLTLDEFESVSVVRKIKDGLFRLLSPLL